MKNKEKLAIAAIYAVLAAIVRTTFQNEMLDIAFANAVLLIAVESSGLGYGIAVALAAEVLAKLVGVQPYWIAVPFAALGNVAMLASWQFISRYDLGSKFASRVFAIVPSSICKCLALLLGAGILWLAGALSLSWDQLLVELMAGFLGGAIMACIYTVATRKSAKYKKGAKKSAKLPAGHKPGAK
ncbi:MAG: hypothetical protein LBT59_17835 [Clostridiales bacterium]|jgi:hypothetical protein|nr:hypothetical protein [Clostridiales bacterium]